MDMLGVATMGEGGEGRGKDDEQTAGGGREEWHQQMCVSRKCAQKVVQRWMYIGHFIG